MRSAWTIRHSNAGNASPTVRREEPAANPVSETRFRATKRYRRLTNLALLTVSFCIGVSLLECTLRWTHLFGARLSWSQPDPYVNFRFIPGAKYWVVEENDHPISGTINRWGWRGAEWSLEKDPAVCRIAVLGDSYAEAFQVESDSTFEALTEGILLRSAHKNVEVMNFGRSGCTQTEELLFLSSDVMKFHPDLVVLFFYPDNDIDDIAKATAPDRERPFFTLDPRGQLLPDFSFTQLPRYRIKRVINNIKTQSALVSLLIERYNAWRLNRLVLVAGEQQRSRAGSGRLQGYWSLCTTHPDSQYAVDYSLNKRLIAEAASVARRDSSLFLLACLDVESYVPEVDQEKRDVDSTFNSNFFEDDLAHFADSLHLEYLGLQRIFAQTYRQTGRPLHWAHWNYEGHRVVASALSQKLRGILERRWPGRFSSSQTPAD